MYCCISVTLELWKRRQEGQKSKTILEYIEDFEAIMGYMRFSLKNEKEKKGGGKEAKKEGMIGEIVFQIRARTAFVEDPRSVPSTMSAGSTISDVL